jgi:hypothetical protein
LYGNKALIKHLYPSRAKCYMHVPEEEQIRISKLSPRRIKCNIVGYTELSKIFKLYDPHKHRVFTSRDVVFPDSTKRLESIEIELLADLPFGLDNDAA